MSKETRSIFHNFSSDGKTLTGYAAVFNAPTRITDYIDGKWKTFTEVIRKGAFSRALASGGDILICFNHDMNVLLGRTSSGTASLVEDDKGLKFTVTLPEYASHVRELASRGDLNGASFTFQVRKGGERWNGENRELTDVWLYECGPVVNPAYKQTSLALRSLNNKKRLLELYENL